MSKATVVLAMLLLLGSVGVIFREMDRSREKPDISKDVDAAARRKLQTEIDEVKKTLQQLGQENKRLKQENAELGLRKEELVVCRDNLQKAKQEKKKVGSWAISVDDEKEERKKEVKAVKGKLKEEVKKSKDLEKEVTEMNNKLSSAKSSLEKIEKQKAKAEADYKKGSEKQKMLEAKLQKAENKGSEKMQNMIEQQLESLKKDLKQKSNAIEELTLQKKSSGERLRRLEGVLMEAGLDPAEVERQRAEKRAVASPKMVNPAAAAMMQVGQGTNKEETMMLGMADAIFPFADDNGDLAIDFEEFIRHVRPTLHEEAKTKPNWRGFLKDKFKSIDRDNSNFITKAEATGSAANLVKFLVSKEEMSVLNGTKSVDEILAAPEAKKDEDKTWVEKQNAVDMPERKGLLSKRGGFGNKGLLPVRAAASEPLPPAGAPAAAPTDMPDPAR